METVTDLRPPNPRAAAVKDLAAWSNRIAALRRSPSLAQYAELRVCKLAKTRAGDVVVVPVADQRFTQTHASAYPARFAKKNLAGREALAAFFDGEGEAWTSYTDEQVYEAAREYAADADLYLTGHDLRNLAVYVTLGLLARRGAGSVRKTELPL